MTAGKQPLPQFERPPLVEVILDVQFKPLEQLLIPEIGALWHHLKDRFGSIEQHPPLEPMIERFGIPAGVQAPRIELMQTPPIPRIWFVDPNQRDLVQVQQDRFIRNWRRLNESDTYPRYEEHVRPRFIEDYQDFIHFLEREGVGRPVPVQCEVTYVNHIFPCEGWERHGDVGRIFNFWRDPEDVGAELDLDEVRSAFAYLIKHEGEPVGRLRIFLEPALRAADKKPMYVFRITARGKPFGDDLDGVVKFFDLGRDKIVRAFTNLTSELMHKEWGREDVER